LHLLSKDQVIHTNLQLLVLGDFETTDLETITIKQNLIVYLFADTIWFYILSNAMIFVNFKCGLGVYIYNFEDTVCIA